MREFDSSRQCHIVDPNDMSVAKCVEDMEESLYYQGAELPSSFNKVLSGCMSVFEVNFLAFVF